MKADILIKGGNVLDVANNINKVCDVAIVGNKIMKVQSDIEMECDVKLNAKGCIVSPGLIDHHLHMFAEGTDAGVYADLALLPSGVTTGADGGSPGASNYELYRKVVINNSHVSIKPYINIASAGMLTRRYPENINPDYYDSDRLQELFNKYPDEILGLKVRVSKELFTGFEKNPLKETIKIAGKIGCRIVVHVTNPAINIDEIVTTLRPGDVVIHAFQGKGDTIIGSNGKVKDSVKSARARGVIFDVSNGKYNFTFNVAKAAIADNFLPDVISTDMNTMIMYKHPVISMPYLMSKYINMGMNIFDVFKSCTQTPAALMGMEGSRGTLAPGYFADVAIFKLIDQEAVFYDCDNNFLRGNKLLVPQMTIKSGNIMYRQLTFTDEIRN